MGLRDLFKRSSDAAAETESAAAERPRRPRKGPCPQCGAPPSQRVESCGFGPVQNELCGVCAHDFGVIHG
jgi:hypothetical protein